MSRRIVVVAAWNYDGEISPECQIIAADIFLGILLRNASVNAIRQICCIILASVVAVYLPNWIIYLSSTSYKRELSVLRLSRAISRKVCEKDLERSRDDKTQQSFTTGKYVYIHNVAMGSRSMWYKISRTRPLAVKSSCECVALSCTCVPHAWSARRESIRARFWCHTGGSGRFDKSSPHCTAQWIWNDCSSLAPAHGICYRSHYSFHWRLSLGCISFQPNKC